MRLTIIYPDGSEKVEQHDGVPLEMLQEHAGGPIQLLHHLVQYDNQECNAWVNEEGCIRRLPLNEKATALWKFFLGEGPFWYEPQIFGNLVIEQED